MLLGKHRGLQRTRSQLQADSFCGIFVTGDLPMQHYNKISLRVQVNLSFVYARDWFVSRVSNL